jgi:hypothetical protein
MLLGQRGLSSEANPYEEGANEDAHLSSPELIWPGGLCRRACLGAWCGGSSDNDDMASIGEKITREIAKTSFGAA